MSKFTLNRDETILIVIDIQDKLAAVMDKRDKVVANTNILVQTAKEMDIPVLVTEQYPKGIGPTVSEIEENLTDAQKFEKISFSIYVDDIKEAIDKLGRKKVILTGMETHICVLQSARDLLENGYEVFVARDGVTSRTEENFLNGLEIMKDMGAVISNTETIMYDLLKKAGTPEFKVLSKLIK